ncbi:hypothetical protein CYMTET_39572 [Cymbomonas tetramitiformis]|uniref:Ankyrin repeat domain-containing protein n=1 Tax=Cymbomonas tetramitiformis TaxID=36881 RepID=A0AAE0C9U6_9CHLO|nr:hypothetical protein CYMTET_39572 [Cymbomonas tetramitiformis]
MSAEDDPRKARPASARPASARPSSARPQSARPVDNRTMTVVLACLTQLKGAVTNAAGASPEILEGVGEMLGTLAPIFAEADGDTQALLSRAMAGETEAIEKLVEVLEPKLLELQDKKESEENCIAPMPPASDEAEKLSAQSTVEAGEQSLTLHRAVWEGDVAKLSSFDLSDKSLHSAFDPHGQTVLHLAVLRKDQDMITALLQAGFDPRVANRDGWTVLEQALLLPYECEQRRDLVRQLYLDIRNRAKSDFNAHKPALLKALGMMPDFTMKLDWCLDSKLFGKLVRSVSPHDQYTIYKKGYCMRVDSTLKGLDEAGGGMTGISWKRGDLSLFFTGNEGSNSESGLHLVDHDNKTIIDMMSDKTLWGTQEEEALEKEIDTLLKNSAEHVDITADDARFAPATRMLGGDVLETVSGWNTKVYLASAQVKGRRVVADVVSEEHLAMYAGSFDDYLEAARKSDSKVEPSVTERSHQLKGRAWMAEKFPLSAEHVIPILDILIPTNRHLQAMKRFLTGWVQQDNRFPVKIQVPLMLSVFAVVCFSEIKLEQTPDEMFVLPKYMAMSFDEALESLMYNDLDQGFEVQAMQKEEA